MTAENGSTRQHSVKAFAKEAVHDLLHFDKKLFKSIFVLIFKPGVLTECAVNEGPSKYMKPLGLFIFVNFLFFVFKNHGLFSYNLSTYQSESWFNQFAIHYLQQAKVPYEVFEAKFNTAMHFEQKGFFILLVPILALGIKLLYLNQHRYYVEHLVFSLHVFSFFLLYLLVIPIVYAVLFFIFKIISLSVKDNEATLLSVLIPLTTLWVAFAVKKYYKESWLLTIIKTIVIIAILLALIAAVYRTLLFFIVLHAI